MELQMMAEATLALLMVVLVFVCCQSFKASMGTIRELTTTASKAEVGEDTTAETREGSDRLFFRTSID